jgi:hypothetical protein
MKTAARQRKASHGDSSPSKTGHRTAKPLLAMRLRTTRTYPMYLALLEMNHAFDNAVAGLEEAGRLKMLRLEYVYGAQVTLESVRANANYNALASAGDREMHNAFRYDRRRQKWEDSRKDPEDILRQAEAYRAAKEKTKTGQR